ncbi:MAG: hypothetical protein ACR2I5_09425, partial [Candidatus Limnocylindria bacterium]
MTGVTVLGSTGSIGRQTLEVLGGLRDRFEVMGLGGGERSDMLYPQSATRPDPRSRTDKESPNPT